MADIKSVFLKKIIANEISFVYMKFSNIAEAIKKGRNMKIMDRIALALIIIGALNWGSIGLFSFDIVAWIGGGMGAVFSRIVYTLVSLAGLWCISLLFRPDALDVYEYSDTAEQH